MDAEETRGPVAISVQCVREIHVPISFHRRARTVRFYVDFLGLKPWPRSVQIPGGIGVGPTRRGLLLRYAHDSTADPMRRRLCFTTPAIARVERVLLDRGWPFDRVRTIGWGGTYLVVNDPEGHRIEIRQARQW